MSLERFWAEVVQGGVEKGAVVEHLDVLEHGGAGEGVRWARRYCGEGMTRCGRGGADAAVARGAERQIIGTPRLLVPP